MKTAADMVHLVVAQEPKDKVLESILKQIEAAARQGKLSLMIDYTVPKRLVSKLLRAGYDFQTDDNTYSMIRWETAYNNGD